VGAGSRLPRVARDMADGAEGGHGGAGAEAEAEGRVEGGDRGGGWGGGGLGVGGCGCGVGGWGREGRVRTGAGTGARAGVRSAIWERRGGQDQGWQEAQALQSGGWSACVRGKAVHVRQSKCESEMGNV